MTRILGISGSLRKGSFNTALLRAAQEMMPSGAELIQGSIAGIPLYNADDEAANGLPAAVETLKAQIAGADGVLLVSPEYNNSIPGVFKNAIDWTTRPAGDIPRVYGGRPIAVIGASLGGFGTLLAQDAWLSVLRTLGTKPWFEGRLLVSRAGSVFDDDGKISDEAMGQRLSDFIAGFTMFAQAQKTAAT